MFINLSNHPHMGWQPEQKKAALQYGEIIDLPFPQVDPGTTGMELDVIVAKYYDQVWDLVRPVVERKDGEPVVIMLQGEMTFTFRLVTRLKADRIRCVAACSERKVEECVSENGEIRKNVVFQFAGFREY